MATVVLSNPAYSRVAMRTARIMLGRAASEAELATLAPVGDDVAGLVKAALALPAMNRVAERQRVARAYNAMLGRYDQAEPVNIGHFMQFLALGDYAIIDPAPHQSNLVQDVFAKIRDSGYRDDPCAAPVVAGAPMAVVRDPLGNPLVFAIGAHKRCTLFRLKDGAWGQLELSEALPGPRHCHVQALALRQQADGTITIAIAVCNRRGSAASTLYVAAGLSNALDDHGWLKAFASMQGRPGAPAGLEIDHVTIAGSEGDPPMVLVGAALTGVMNSYYFDLGADPGPWSVLRIPEDANTVLAYALGRYRGLAGVWTLYLVGPDRSLVFSGFPDEFGKTINVNYTGLPAHCSSFLLGRQGDIPDVYATGDGVAVYRAGHDAPEQILDARAAPGSTLVWADKTAGAEHVAFLSADRQLKTVSFDAGRWTSPVTVADGLDSATLLGGSPTAGGFNLVGVAADGALEWRQLLSGGVSKTTEITQRAAWDEIPLTAAELNAAIAGAAPIAYLATDEQYFPSNVQFFLAKVGLWNEMQQKWQLPPGSLLDPATHDMVEAALITKPRSALGSPKRDSDYVLKIPDEASSQLLPGHPNDAPFYIHAKFKPGENATHLIFWAFYPYNGAGLLKLDTPGLSRRVDLNPLGTHEGDWEHFLLQVDNDTHVATKTYLSQHDSGTSVDVSQLERDAATGRPIFYISRHGHACYVTQGDNLLAESKTALYHIGLINHTDRGMRIDISAPGRSSLISAPWLGADAPKEPVWLRFPWRWGRYLDFTGKDMKEAVDNIVAGVVPGPITGAVADAIIKSGVLGGEGNSAGPSAITQKANWFGSEDD
ncbi:MAG: hypothetical protein QOF41_1923 [Methylobacteriaceae bacterium]|nr:hypothetical protein [Methylobacteriaceae bacterium]